MADTKKGLRDTEQTGRLIDQARRVLAYEHFDSIAQKPFFGADDQVFPQAADSACGFEIVDTMGRVYVDWVNGGGPVLLGYRRAEVEDAIRKQLEAGPTLSLLHPLQVEVATMLTEMVPCAEMVAFGKNGSDVLAAAARIARAVTGRDVILYHGMHGFHDWFACTAPGVRGIPEALKPLIHSFSYNDLEGLQRLLDRFSSDVAAVFMEPVREQLPEPGYLEGVRRLTTQYGALLVFDEVVTALRLGPGGAQEYFDVVPDLACLGKAMANGMPISAIVGPRSYMMHLPSVAFGMTFQGETLSLAAARAVLRIVRDEPVAEHVARIGTRVREAFAVSCDRHGVAASLSGPPVRMTFVFHEAPGISATAVQSLFIQECLKHGVLTNGNVLPSYAHDDEAVQRTARGFDAALAVVGQAVRASETAGPGDCSRQPCGPRATFSRGYVETLRLQGGAILISGWALLDGWAPERVEIVTEDSVSTPAVVVLRPDLAEAFPAVSRAQYGGYQVAVPVPAFPAEGPIRLTLCLVRGEFVDFRCRILIESRPDVDGAWPGPHWTGDGFLVV
jgi:glutamate-1-semialdehyde 2,1-aminomutase